MKTSREPIEKVLRSRTTLSDEQMNRVEEVIGPDPDVVKVMELRPGPNPSRRTILCILALLEHIEDLEERVQKLERVIG